MFKHWNTKNVHVEYFSKYLEKNDINVTTFLFGLESHNTEKNSDLDFVNFVELIFAVKQ